MLFGLDHVLDRGVPEPRAEMVDDFFGAIADHHDDLLNTGSHGVLEAVFNQRLVEEAQHALVHFGRGFVQSTTTSRCKYECLHFTVPAVAGVLKSASCSSIQAISRPTPSSGRSVGCQPNVARARPISHTK